MNSELIDKMTVDSFDAGANWALSWAIDELTKNPDFPLESLKLMLASIVQHANKEESK